MRSGLEDIFHHNNRDTSITGVGSMFAIHFQRNTPKNAKDSARNDSNIAKDYYSHMLSRNIVYLSSSLPHCFISWSHSEEDVEEYLASTEEYTIKNQKPD